MKGLYIAFEGGVGCGKDTVINCLTKYLQVIFPSLHCLSVREPGTAKVSEELRKLAQWVEYEADVNLTTEVYLYLAARANLYSTVIVPKVDDGYIVLSARTWPSTYAYQGVAYGFGRERVLNIHEDLFKICFPNYILYFDIPPEVGLARIAREGSQDRSKDDKHEAKIIEVHNAARDAYLELGNNTIFKEHPNCWHQINADQAPDLVMTDTLTLLVPLISSHYSVNASY